MRNLKIWHKAIGEAHDYAQNALLEAHCLVPQKARDILNEELYARLVENLISVIYDVEVGSEKSGVYNCYAIEEAVADTCKRVLKEAGMLFLRTERSSGVFNNKRHYYRYHNITFVVEGEKGVSVDDSKVTNINDNANDNLNIVRVGDDVIRGHSQSTLCTC